MRSADKKILIMPRRGESDLDLNSQASTDSTAAICASVSANSV
jgi:hypothetical protein